MLCTKKMGWRRRALAPPEWRALGVPPCRGAGALETPHYHMPNLIHCMTAQNRHPRVENRVQAHGPGVRRLPKAEGGHKGQCVAQRYTDTESNDSHAAGAAAATGSAARSVCADTTKPSWIVSITCTIPSAYSKHINLVSKTIFDGCDGRGEVLYIGTQLSNLFASLYALSTLRLTTTYYSRRPSGPDNRRQGLLAVPCAAALRWQVPSPQQSLGRLPRCSRGKKRSFPLCSIS